MVTSAQLKKLVAALSGKGGAAYAKAKHAAGEALGVPKALMAQGEAMQALGDGVSSPVASYLGDSGPSIEALKASAPSLGQLGQATVAGIQNAPTAAKVGMGAAGALGLAGTGVGLMGAAQGQEQVDAMQQAQQADQQQRMMQAFSTAKSKLKVGPDGQAAISMKDIKNSINSVFAPEIGANLTVQDYQEIAAQLGANLMVE